MKNTLHYIFLILVILGLLNCSKSPIKTVKKTPEKRDMAMVYYKKGREHFLKFSRKDVETAIGYFNKALKLKSGFIKAHAARAEALSYLAFQKERNGNNAKEEFALAKKDAVKAVTNGKKVAESHRALAWYFFTAGLYNYAASSARKALEFKPDDPEANFILWVAVDNKNANSPYLQKSIKGGYIIALLNAGSIMRKNKKYSKAIEYFKKVIERVPGHIHARVNIANVYLKKGEYEKSQKYYEKAMKLAPGDSYIIFNYAASFVSMKKYKKAEKYYKQAVSINKNFIHAHLMLMRLYKKVFHNKQKYNKHKRVVAELRRKQAMRIAKRIKEARNIGL